MATIPLSLGGRDDENRQPHVKTSQNLVFLLRFIINFICIYAFQFVLCLWFISSVLNGYFLILCQYFVFEGEWVH